MVEYGRLEQAPVRQSSVSAMMTALMSRTTNRQLTNTVIAVGRLSDDSRHRSELLLPSKHIRYNTHTLPGFAVWCSGNVLVSINAVALHRARLVLGWVTSFGQVNCLIT